MGFSLLCCLLAPVRGRMLGSGDSCAPHLLPTSLPRYWRFNEDTRSVDPGYPKPISVWVGIPPSPKGAFLSPDACK